MILGIYIQGASDEDKQGEEYKRVCNVVIAAGTECINDLAGQPKARKVIERASRLHIKLLRELDGGHRIRVDKLGLIFFHMIRYIIESGYLEYVEGSAFDQSITEFMGSLQAVASEDKINASAQKQAKRGLRFLQSEGYYQGIDLDNLT